MPALYRMSFSPATMARLTRLLRAGAVFAEYYEAAMGYSVNLVATKAKENAHARFARPTGTLARGINGYVRTPFLGEVGVGVQVPYARRRELGFSGMTDRLGRYYAQDPGAFYLRDGLRASEPGIVAAFHEANALAVRRMILP